MSVAVHTVPWHPVDEDEHGQTGDGTAEQSDQRCDRQVGTPGVSSVTTISGRLRRSPEEATSRRLWYSVLIAVMRVSSAVCSSSSAAVRAELDGLGLRRRQICNLLLEIGNPVYDRIDLRLDLCLRSSSLQRPRGLPRADRRLRLQRRSGFQARRSSLGRQSGSPGLRRSGGGVELGEPILDVGRLGDESRDLGIDVDCRRIDREVVVPHLDDDLFGQLRRRSGRRERQRRLACVSALMPMLGCSSSVALTSFAASSAWVTRSDGSAECLAARSATPRRCRCRLLLLGNDELDAGNGPMTRLDVAVLIVRECIRRTEPDDGHHNDQPPPGPHHTAQPAQIHRFQFHVTASLRLPVVSATRMFPLWATSVNGSRHLVALALSLPDL